MIKEAKMTKNKIAVIDMGTNSVRLLLCELSSQRIIYREKLIETTRLGAGVDQYKKLSDESMDLTYKALKKYRDICSEKGYELIRSIGTSAIRDAKNREAFLNNVRDILPCPVDVIDGKEEATLGYIGVVNGVNEKAKNFIIDIGGGSTELIFGESKIDFMDSLDIGAVRLKDRCIHHDPPTKKELIFLREEINKILDDFIENHQNLSFDQVVGIGGTITTLSAINQSLGVYDSKKIHGSRVSYHALRSIIERLISVNETDRKDIKGLNPRRSDIIIPGSIILEELFKRFDFDEIIVSDFDNLEGMIFKAVTL